jgi:hypothetical protein
LGIDILENKEIITDIKKEFPYEHIIFGSTAGEIMGSQVNDNHHRYCNRV